MKKSQVNNLDFELQLYSQNKINVLGIDEVGRGPLAGPMVVAGVVFRNNDVLSLKNIQTVENPYLNINDSKKVTKKLREKLALFIKEKALAYEIIEISNILIDEKGISQATQMGFFNVYKAIQNKLKRVDHILTDHFGINAVPEHMQTNILKGDMRSISIGAASIIAKVYRDNLMVECGLKYPEYGFETHMGYGTKKHIAAINTHGICEIHRKSFEPIKSKSGRGIDKHHCPIV